LKKSNHTSILIQFNKKQAKATKIERDPQQKRRVLLSRESKGKPARALPVPTSTPRNTEAALPWGMVAATGWWEQRPSRVGE